MIGGIETKRSRQSHWLERFYASESKHVHFTGYVEKDERGQSAFHYWPREFVVFISWFQSFVTE